MTIYYESFMAKEIPTLYLSHAFRLLSLLCIILTKLRKTERKKEITSLTEQIP